MEGCFFNASAFSMIEQLIEDYEWGIVRLCTIFDRKAKGNIKSRLLFANVELIPKGLAKPTTSKIDKLDIAEAKTLFFRHVATTAETALAWYRSNNREFHTPIPFDIAAVENLDGLPFLVPELTDMPLWPILEL